MLIAASSLVSINFDKLIFLYNRSSTNLFNSAKGGDARGTFEEGAGHAAFGAIQDQVMSEKRVSS